jgi:hypothetical protein
MDTKYRPLKQRKIQRLKQRRKKMMETLTEKKLGFSSLKRNWVSKAEKKLGFSRLKRNWVSPD